MFPVIAKSATGSTGRNIGHIIEKPEFRLKPLVCPRCGAVFPEPPEVIGGQFGGYLEIRCPPPCGLFVQVPWGRIPNALVTYAIEKGLLKHDP